MIFDMEPTEGQRYEAKQSTAEWREIVETVAAFATSQGGLIEVGIAPDGAITGIDIGGGTVEDLTNKIRQNTDPRQGPTVSVNEREGRKVLCLHVVESREKPVAAFGVPYKRVGPSNHRLSMSEIRQLIAETGVGRWEDRVCSQATMGDISRDAVAGFLDMARAASRLEDFTCDDPEGVFERLSLICDDGIKHAAVALFAGEPGRFLPQVTIKCAVFPGSEPVDFLDELTVSVNIFEQIERALAFIDRNMRHAIEITGAARRKDHWDYAREAVREAVINAVCHRDYESTGQVQCGCSKSIWRYGTRACSYPA
ncbi:MAG: putative DNA binding domain-containing protein [Armatimonadetes bacterium]|nr:putative DNA binding domain-containing protein [Armatimonadota bacterium]